MSKIIVRKTRWVTVKFDGLVFHVTNSAVRSERQDALEMQAIYEELAGGKQYPVLVDARNSKNAPSEAANEIFRTERYCRPIEFMVVVLEGRLVAHAATVYGSIIEIPIDIKYFANERDAIAEIFRRSPRCRQSTLLPQDFQTGSVDVAYDENIGVASLNLNRSNTSELTQLNEIAREFEILTASRAETFKVLLDDRKFSRRIFNVVSKISAPPIDAIAAVAHPFICTWGNLWFGAKSRRIPVRFFTDEGIAKSWLGRIRSSHNLGSGMGGVSVELDLLTQAFEKFSKGDYSEIPLENVQDDAKTRLFLNALNLLASKVNHQIVALEKANHVLESRVADRTRELEDQRARAVEQSRLVAVGRFAAGLAHEVNNPLAVINSAASLIRRKQERGMLTPDELMTRVESITSMVERATQIVKSVRSISRDSSDDPMYKESISEIVRETLALSEVAFRERGIHTSFDAADGLCAECRRSEIGQVLVNLLNNARDAVHELPPEQRWIKVNLMERGDHVVISVENGGPAIPAEVRARIMEPFFTTKPVGKGTGLGLSLSLAIARLHGGSLRLLDQESTCFELSIPKSRGAKSAA